MTGLWREPHNDRSPRPQRNRPPAGASILVMHMVIPELATGVARRLHAPPTVIGKIAAAAEPGKLVLSHFMARSLRNLDENVELVRAAYDGDVIPAEDLLCVLP